MKKTLIAVLFCVMLLLTVGAAAACQDFGAKSAHGVKTDFGVGELTKEYNAKYGTGLRWHNRFLARFGYGN